MEKPNTILLPDHDDEDEVVLESGLVVVTGRLVVEFDMEVIRRAGGFREYANKVVMGPLL